MSKQHSTLSKQHSTLLPKMANKFIIKFRCCFNIVAGFGNNVERNSVLLKKSNQTEHVQFVSNLSNFVHIFAQNQQHCRQKWQHCGSNIWLCRKNHLTCSIQQCCFDIVAGVDGALIGKELVKMSLHSSRFSCHCRITSTITTVCESTNIYQYAQ